MLKNIVSCLKNNKIVFILLTILMIYLLYTYFNKDEINMETEKTDIIQESFISSDAFVGRKDGYVFKNDRQGLGYYIDKIEQ